jgi:hypothetical protein
MPPAPPVFAPPSPPPARRGGSLAALLAAAAAQAGAAAGACAAPLRLRDTGGAAPRARRVARPLARISEQLSPAAPAGGGAGAKAGAPPLPSERARRGGRGGVLSRASGGVRFVAGLALLPLRLLPLPRARKNGKNGGSSAGDNNTSSSASLSAPPPLSRAARERAGASARALAAREETRALFLHTNPSERRRASDFFATLAHPSWRLESIHAPSGTEIWRLPGGRFHTIMGVADVAAAPSTALELFRDPKAVFTKVFPRVDAMFLSGTVLASARGGFAACAARFRLPALVGGGAAPGFPAREFVWTQYVTRLASGNVLVTARSCDGDAPGAVACRQDARCPAEAALPRCTGAVRGALLTSGYYGRAIGTNGPIGTKNGAATSACSRVYYIVQADPGGVLPAWLVNFAAAKQAHNVTRLAAMFRNGQLVPA